MKPIRIAQLSDLHLTSISYNPFRLLSKRLLGTLNYLFKRKNVFSKKQIDALPSLLKTLNLDWIFLGGDFTTTALPKEFAMAQEFVKALPAPWIAVPGNHDHYTQTAYHTKRFYKALEQSPSLVNVRQLNENWYVVTLDTARATWSHVATGLFSQKIEKEFIEALQSIAPEASILVLNHYPFFQHGLARHRLKRGKVLQQIIEKDLRIKAYLHGHTHQHIIADLQPSSLPLILDSGSCADSKKGTFHILTIDDTQIEIDVYRWNDIHKRTQNLVFDDVGHPPLLNPSVYEWKLESTQRYLWTRGLTQA